MLTKFAQWLHNKELAHTFISLVIITIGVVSGYMWESYIFTVGFWLGRERRDVEVGWKIPVRRWYDGWGYVIGHIDFYLPVIVCGVVLILVEHIISVVGI